MYGSMSKKGLHGEFDLTSTTTDAVDVAQADAEKMAAADEEQILLTNNSSVHRQELMTTKYRAVLTVGCLFMAAIGALLLFSGDSHGGSVSTSISFATKSEENKIITEQTHGDQPDAEEEDADLDRPDEIIMPWVDGTAYPDFKLYSSAFTNNSDLPSNFSCLGSDGGHNPPFYWEGAPENTVSFAFLLHSAKHWDFALFNIPASQTSITEDCSYSDQRDYYACGGAAAGSYPDKSKYYYSPPCSSGPGSKTYYWVVYALSDYLVPDDPSDDGDDAGHFDYAYAGFTVHDMVTLMENITLATSKMISPFTHYT
jgi:phosphatidylethanolamine-binding protein (PEBP) family uncharacterized protein